MLPRHNGERAELAPLERVGRFGPGAHVEHAARTEGDLGQARQRAALTDERRLLIAGDAADRRSTRQRPRLTDDAR